MPCPLYLGITNKLIDKLHKVVMSAARAAIGNYCFKKSIIYILNKCNILEIKDLILLSSLSFLHKIDKNRKPESIINHFKIPNKRAKIFEYRPIYMPKLQYIQNGLFYRGAQIYNELPIQMKQLKHDKFQKSLKSHLKENNIWDTND